MTTGPRSWHQLTIPEVTEALGVDPTSGLPDQEAARRLVQEGPNEIPDRSQRGPLAILWSQFTSLMVAILIAAAAISAALGDTTDALAILAIVLLNALLGFQQEHQAERALAGLRQLSQPVSRVVRDGRIVERASRQLVTGDVVLLEAGNLVSGDARLLDAVQLRTQEAALTGESEAVEKDATLRLAAEAPLGDRRNMVYSGTLVSNGRGRAVIVATGARTEMGRIAELIQKTDRGKTPLQIKLDELSRRLAAVALVAVTLVVLVGLWHRTSFKDTFLTGVSLMVASVPEGLPAVVTIALALGARRMLRQKALVRQLSAVETLGAVTVICTDKTGTLTENRMRVTGALVGGREYELGEGAAAIENQDLRLILACGALVNDAHLSPQASGSPPSLGDPMEIALAEAARGVGLEKQALEQIFPRLTELPFDSDRRRMTTVHRVDAAEAGSLRDVVNRLSGAPGDWPFVAVTKGAVVELLAVCDRVWMDGRAAALTAEQRSAILKELDRLAAAGARVLGIAFRTLPAIPEEQSLETGLTFLGMTALVDPARAEVPQAMETCRAAGIRPIMITGDYPLTSRYVAGQVGLAEDAQIVTGAQLDKLDAAGWNAAVREASIFARVTPQQKLGIVEALRRQGEIVAMTGDGVNDAPALRKADIGIAMGRSGTDVAREAASMVLQDDNFATIVAAVEEGRVIYDNLRKFARYMLASNSGELWVMLLGPVLGMPLPLLPLQILWMNLVTDGLPALALAVEPAEEHTMRRPPRDPAEGFFGKGMGWWILKIGGLLGLVALACGYGFWRTGRDTWQTMLFTVLTLSQLALAFASRSERTSLLRQGLLTNRPMLGAVLLALGLQLAVVYAPAAQALFHTRALSSAELGLCLVVSSVVFWVVECGKWLDRLRNSDPIRR